MQKKIEEHIFQGMQRDMSISKQKPEYLWDAHNIRLTARHGDTLLSMTNEKGTLLFDPDNITFEGVILGYCVIGEYLTVFTTDPTAESKPDHIYRLKKEDDEFSIIELYNGNLNFKVNCPIECLGVYENVGIQKVYWTDGQNQPRMINITKDLVNTSYIDTSFDFIPTLALKDTIHVTKVADSSGIFAAGVIQYAVTYYNKYGQESNVSVVSPLIPTSYTQRAGSPEETIGNAFKVTVKNPDLHFEFMRIYSIFRSSKDTTPVCKRVADVRLGYGGESALNLYKDNAETTRYARINFSTAEIKTDWNSDFVLLNSSANDRYKGTETVDIDKGMIFSANRYYHFTKQNTPYLIIKARMYNDHDGKWDAKPTFFTWESCTEIYLAMDPGVKGPGNWDHQLMWADGGGGYMYKADYMYYGTSDFVVNNAITITDNGTVGEDIDYNELLFVGGEEITAGTITQKDGTMFLGDIKIKRPQVESNDLDIIDDIRNVNANATYRKCCFPVTMNSSSYKWGNTLDAHIYTDSDTGENTNIAGFKHGEHYRLGFQFQYKTGKWSQPVFINDVKNTNRPSLLIQDNIYVLNVPSFTASLPTIVANKLLNNGYKRVRGVICFPKESDQLILCQGLLNPTVHSIAGRLNHTPDVQSSWYFRPIPLQEEDSIQFNDGGIVQYKDGYTLYGPYEYLDHEELAIRPSTNEELQNVTKDFSDKPILSLVISDNNYELQNSIAIEDFLDYRGTVTIKDARDLTNVFVVDWKYLTFHSPEFEFNDSFRNMDMRTFDCKITGKYPLKSNQGDIHITTSSSPNNSDAPGFYHRVVLSEQSARRINSGLFYKDSCLYENDIANNNGELNNNAADHKIVSFVVYPWHRTGSLNNDCVRPYGNTRARTSVLSQKKLINIMYFDDSVKPFNANLNKLDMQMFNSDLISITKIHDKNYFGNVDQVISSSVSYPIGLYQDPDFWRYFSRGRGFVDDHSSEKGIVLTNDPVYMKYKSTPHAIIHTGATLSLTRDTTFNDGTEDEYILPKGDFVREQYPYLFRAEMYREQNPAADFGGTSEHALQSNLWYPAGPAVEIKQNTDTPVEFLYGDTYYQRYDCLKTYPFTDEDTNSIIEIGSFMVETRINLDGRYDKNRGNTQNFMLNPTNFNLINPVYSQMDNFFNYRILDKDYYKLSEYPTMVTWTGYKNNASEVDSWTNITLASTLEMDGTKGQVNAVRANSDQLYCFQDDAIGQILFNSRVQISPSDGVPIEISNNYKVDGNRYISTSIGCKNKWSIAEGIDGLYFIDDNTKALYQLGGQAQLKPISTPLNMSYWFMEQDCSTSWIQRYYISDNEIKQQGIKCFYDNANADLYICTPETTLCYSEKLGQFVSFFDYHNVIGMFNIDSDYWSLNYPEYDSTTGIKLWWMFKSIYNTFYGKVYPTHFTFISNENPLNDKIFSNIELRGDFRLWSKNKVWEDFDSPSHVVDHRKMFDSVRVWDEYQDTGDIDLNFINDVPSNMKKKFRIWRMDIPRDKDNTRQRIRNTWVKVKFTMNGLKPISLDDLNANVSSEFIVWNNNEWTNLDLRNTLTNRYVYNQKDDCIDETTRQGVLLAKYTFNNNGTVLMKTIGGVKQPYAYRKIHDMEIHDIGVVYFT